MNNSNFGVTCSGNYWLKLDGETVYLRELKNDVWKFTTKEDKREIYVGVDRLKRIDYRHFITV